MEQILSLLNLEKHKIEAAIAALTEGSKRRGRPPKNAALASVAQSPTFARMVAPNFRFPIKQTFVKPTPIKPSRKRGPMSAAQKAILSKSAKLRWARFRRDKKSAA